MIARRCGFMVAEPRADPAGLPDRGRARPRTEELRQQARGRAGRRLTPVVRRCARHRARRRAQTLSRAAGLTSSTSSRDGLRRLLPDRRRLHPMGEGQGIPVGPGRGSGAGSVVAWALDDHRPRSAALRPAVRALPQPRARVDAGLRHRLLPGPARRGDPLRAARSTARDRVAADHHLRQAAGARRAARRRPRARHALRPGRPDLPSWCRTTRPTRPTLEQAIEVEPRLAEAAREDDQVAPPDRDRACSSKACPATPRPTPPAW